MGEVTSYSDYRAGSIFQRTRNPRVFFPQPGEKDVFKDSVFEVGAFASLYGDLERAYRVFEIRDPQQRWGDAFFRYEADQDNLDLVEHGLDEVLEFTKPYVFRVCDVLTDGTSSDWTEVPFSMHTVEVLAPTPIGPADGGEVYSPQPTLETEPMETSAGSDTHVKSQFRCYRASDDELIYDSSEVDAEISHYMSSSNFPDKYQLIKDTEYYWQARFKGEDWGWSDWSEKAYFITAETPEPEYETPEGEELGTGDYLKTSSYDKDDEHLATEFEIRRKSDGEIVSSSVKESGELTRLELPGEDLDPGKNYQWRARFKGDNWGWGEYSDWRTFHTPVLSTPSGDAPRGGADVDHSDEFEVSGVDVSSGELSIEKTEWQIFTKDGENPYVEVEAGDVRSIGIPAEELDKFTEYRWRMRFYDAKWGYSSWSEKLDFKTSHVETPELLSPEDGTQVTSDEQSRTLEASAFSGGSGSHDMSEWYLLDKDSGELIWDNEQSSSDLTSRVVDTDVLKSDRTYEWQVRYHDENWGWSQWSEKKTFKTPKVKQPEAISPADGEEDVQGPYVTLEASDFEVDGDEGHFEEVEWRVIDKESGEEVFSKVESV